MLSNRGILFLTLAHLLLLVGEAMGQSVFADFQKAQKLFRAEQTLQAQKILKQLAKKYPDHLPSQILLGRIAYLQGKYGRAAKYFRKVPPEMITSDMAYEYGITMFVANNCQRANAGFARVKESDRAIDLANFYRGVCFLRSRNPQRALLYLKKAKKIPENLRETRREALVEARRRIKAEQQGRPIAANAYFVVPTPPPPMPPQPLPGSERQGFTPPSSQAGGKASPPVPATAGFVNTVTPSLTLSQSARTSDFFGYKLNKTETSTNEIKLSVKSRYNFEPHSNGKQPYVQLLADLSRITEKSKGVDSRYIAYADEPGTVIEQETDVSAKPRDDANMSIVPELGWPLGSMLQIMAGYKYDLTYPAFDASKKYGAKTPNGRIVLTLQQTTVEVSGNQREAFDASDATVRSDQLLGGKITQDMDAVDIFLAMQQTTIVQGPAAPAPVAQAGTQQIEFGLTKAWEKFTLAFSVLQWDQTLAAGITENPERPELSSLKIVGSGNWSFDFGASINLAFAQINRSSFRQSFDVKESQTQSQTSPPNTAAPTQKKILNADWSDQEASLVFKLAPIDWAFLQASLLYQRRSYTMEDGEYRQDFEKKNPELISEFKITAGISKAF